MKVKDLVKHLLQLDQELEVYTAGDSEGNSYNSVYFEPTVMYAANAGGNDRHMEVIDESDLEDCGYDEDELTQIVVI